jgi:hypothetical protein
MPDALYVTNFSVIPALDTEQILGVMLADRTALAGNGTHALTGTVKTNKDDR